MDDEVELRPSMPSRLPSKAVLRKLSKESHRDPTHCLSVTAAGPESGTHIVAPGCSSRMGMYSSRNISLYCGLERMSSVWEPMAATLP